MQCIILNLWPGEYLDLSVFKYYIQLLLIGYAFEPEIPTAIILMCS